MITCTVNICRQRSFGSVLEKSLRALPFAHQAKAGSVIGVSTLAVRSSEAPIELRHSSLLRAGRPVLEESEKSFSPGEPEHALRRAFSRDPYWLVNIGIRDLPAGTHEVTQVCALRDALVLRNDYMADGSNPAPEERLKRLADLVEVCVHPQVSNHALIEVLSGVEAHLSNDLARACGLTTAGFALRCKLEAEAQ